MYMATPPLLPAFSSRAGQLEFVELDEDDIDTENLHAHVVLPEAKHLLLSDTLHPGAVVAGQQDLDAHALLLELARLAPSVAKDFAPKGKDGEGVVFRLVDEAGLGGAESGYVAMSYCWGRDKENGGLPRKMVSPVGDLPFGWVRTVEQVPLPVGRSLFEAVVRERGVGEGLWFDQVCINQEDDFEKAAAIGAMDTIYKNARKVIVALEDVLAEESEELFLRWYAEQYEKSELPGHQQPHLGMNPPFMQRFPLLRSFFERMLGSAWFGRAWCAQELRMGRSIVFLVPSLVDEEDGCYTFVRITSAFFLHLLILASECLQLFPSLNSRISSLLLLFLQKTRNDERDAIMVRNPGVLLSPENELPTPFVPTIAEIFRQNASGNSRLPEYLRRLDANRDKTAIALSAGKLPIRMKPASPLQRPTIEDECLRQLLLVGIAAHDPVALCTTGAPLCLHDGSVSWLTHPSSQDIPSSHLHHPLPRFTPKTPITQSSDGRAEYAQLDLVFLDLPHRSHSNPNFPTYVQRARHYIELCMQYFTLLPNATPSFTSWQTPHNPRAPAMKNVFVQTLACCFECGPQWLLDVSARIQPPEHVVAPQAAEALFHPHLAAETYINTPDGRHAFTSVLNLLGAVVALGIPWASGASERTCGPMVVSLSPSPSPSPLEPLPFDSPKAVVFAPFAHSKTLLVAVPEAVKMAEYGVLARGWVLTPFQSFTGSRSPGATVNWTLQGKTVVFGGAGFEGGLGGREGMGGHRVYGPVGVGLASPATV
ncbi:hypothetical protein EJ04DRAFT_561935 [Polyplosphaeria fusca]|uniref:Heterokaryon incompatibility domain-containing protein n=1 Tax=Polyplosphaeria fusca TaxID=682080 RepID=A0A9P4R5H6_9PLEO|nr:hypothetical protein EJ04DRAFT_561935 [Polyplosphaeria fusca]